MATPDSTGSSLLEKNFQKPDQGLRVMILSCSSLCIG